MQQFMRCWLLLASLVVFLAGPCVGSGVYGLDSAGVDIYIDGWECLAESAEIQFGIVRCWHSYGAVDTSATHALANAQLAGVERMDVYMFPCYPCGDPAGQVEAAVRSLANSTYTRFWFDIEGGTEYWSSNPLNNQDFFEAMVQQASDMGQNIGVYTSDFQWEPIMGDTYTGGSSFPLWYAHYDNNPSFSDFTSFGGWSEPAAKQYDDNGEACGYSYDQNWAETINF